MIETPYICIHKIDYSFTYVTHFLYSEFDKRWREGSGRNQKDLQGGGFKQKEKER